MYTAQAVNFSDSCLNVTKTYRLLQNVLNWCLVFGHDVYKIDRQNLPNTATKDNNVLSKPHRKNYNVVNRIKSAFDCINKATIK